jgi:hypothetical protein
MKLWLYLHLVGFTSRRFAQGFVSSAKDTRTSRNGAEIGTHCSPQRSFQARVSGSADYFFGSFAFLIA